MSAAHLEQLFLAPRDFLRGNLLFMVGTLPQIKGIHYFTYEPAMGASCALRARPSARQPYPIRVWYLRLSRASARGAFPAYFLPCQPQPMIRGMLPSSEQFALTASPPGAQFGVARYHGGATEICLGSGQMDPQRMAREMAWCATRLNSAGSGLALQERWGATIIGINMPRRGWYFHAQQWENLDGTHFRYHGLIEL